MTDYNPLIQQLAARRYLNQDHLPCGSPLIDETNREEFLAVASETIEQAELSEVLLRAISFYLGSGASELEISFVSLYAALETILTFFRRQNEYEILGAEEFDELERDLRNWLRQHPLVASDSVKRGLIYEKIRELNRFPFSHVFKRFCEHYSLDLTDLWPILRTGEPWPLMEIRHRLVHGDPFQSRPVESLACARMHLAWVVERMLLCALGWTVSRSNVSYESLQRNCIEHQGWHRERAKFA